MSRMDLSRLPAHHRRLHAHLKLYSSQQPLGWVATAATATASAVATVGTAVLNVGGGLNPIHLAAMANARAQVEAMGITADHSAELGLAELALM